MLQIPDWETPETTSIPVPYVYVSQSMIWEYKQVVSKSVPDETELNELGREGWELTGILDRDSQVLFFFKRQTQ